MTKIAFGLRAVSDIGDTTVSPDRPSSMGKAHEYLVSPYVGKVRLLTRDIRT